MKKIAISALLGTAISGMAIADANAWTRDVHRYGWARTSSVHASGSCSDSSCSRSVTRTGPYRNSVYRQGSVACANSSCSASRTTTGPDGGSMNRTGTITR